MRAVAFTFLGGLCLTLLGGCSAHPSSNPVGTFEKAIPDKLFSALCRLERSNPNYDATADLIFLGETRPIFSTPALRHHYLPNSFSDEAIMNDELRDRELNEIFVPHRLPDTPSNFPCPWKRNTDELSQLARDRHQVLEISNILGNPFVPGHSGVFVRFSVGLQFSAEWFWVPISMENEGWQIEAPIPLAISDF